jgi:hypothetical protein
MVLIMMLLWLINNRFYICMCVRVDYMSIESGVKDTTPGFNVDNIKKMRMG